MTERQVPSVSRTPRSVGVRGVSIDRVAQWPGRSSRPFAFAVSAVVLLGVCVTASGCVRRNGPLSGRASDEWTRSYTIDEGGELQVVGGNGSIDVQGGTEPRVEVRAERVVRATSDAIAQPMVSRVRITEDVTSSKIVLRSEGLGGIVVGAEVEVNFRVTVPPATRLRLRAANGTITVSNIDGSLAVSTNNGTITGTGLRGGVDARSSNGAISIELAGVSKEPVDVHATNGQVELSIPPDANANVEATCKNGSVDTTGLTLEPMGEQTPRRTRGRLNEGGTPIAVSTINGSVRLHSSPVHGQ